MDTFATLVQPVRPIVRKTEDWERELKEKTSEEIPTKSREDANKALENASTSPQTISQMVKEVYGLVKDGNDLDTRLFAVQHLIERAKLPSKDRAKTLRDLYVELLWQSRGIAGSGKAAADDFRGDFIEVILMDDLSPDEKIAEIVSWLKITERKGEDAKKQPQTFQKLTESLKDYAREVEKEIKDQDTEARAQLDKLTAQIEEIDAKIESITVNVVDPIVKYLKLSGGAFSAILSGSPTAALSALLSAVKEGVPELQKFNADLQNASRKRQELQAQKEKLLGEIKTLEDKQLDLGDASTVPSSLRNIADNIQKFADRMTTFTNTFATLEREGRGIEEFLKAGVSVQDPVFSTTIELVRELFGIISKILEIYAKAPLSN